MRQRNPDDLPVSLKLEPNATDQDYFHYMFKRWQQIGHSREAALKLVTRLGRTNPIAFKLFLEQIGEDGSSSRS